MRRPAPFCVPVICALGALWNTIRAMTSKEKLNMIPLKKTKMLPAGIVALVLPLMWLASLAGQLRGRKIGRYDAESIAKSLTTCFNRPPQNGSADLGLQEERY